MRANVVPPFLFSVVVFITLVRNYLYKNSIFNFQPFFFSCGKLTAGTNRLAAKWCSYKLHKKLTKIGSGPFKHYYHHRHIKAKCTVHHQAARLRGIHMLTAGSPTQDSTSRSFSSCSGRITSRYFCISMVKYSETFRIVLFLLLQITKM